MLARLRFYKGPRIVGGFVTKGPLPYQLKNKIDCGAILISRKYAISAEHCKDEFKIDNWVVAGSYLYDNDTHEPFSIQERRHSDLMRNLTKVLKTECKARSKGSKVCII